jgi:hypothetical protein
MYKTTNNKKRKKGKKKKKRRKIGKDTNIHICHTKATRACPYSILRAVTRVFFTIVNDWDICINMRVYIFVRVLSNDMVYVFYLLMNESASGLVKDSNAIFTCRGVSFPSYFVFL